MRAISGAGGALSFPLVLVLACGSSPEKRGTPAPRTAPPPPASAGDSRALTAEEQHYADMMFSDDGTGTSGTVERRPPGGDLDAQLAEVAASGARVDVGRGARGTGGGPSAPGTPPPAPTPPPVTVELAVPRVHDQTSLTPDVLTKKIRTAYASGLKRCFVASLAAGGAASAAVAVRFTVIESGRVMSLRVDGGAPLHDCVAGLLRNWRFDVPKDDDGEPTEASFDLSITFTRTP